MHDLEDIVNTQCQFPVGTMGIHDMRTCGECHHDRTVGLHVGVVLVGEFSPQHLHADIFTPFQLFEQWDAVEDFTVEVPTDIGRNIAVVEKLHVVDQVERVVLNDV